VAGDRGARRGTTYISQQLALDPARFQRVPSSVGGHGIHGGRGALPVGDGEIGVFECQSPTRFDRDRANRLVWRAKVAGGHEKDRGRTGKAVGFQNQLGVLFSLTLSTHYKKIEKCLLFVHMQIL
jgi:hypothetical protein